MNRTQNGFDRVANVYDLLAGLVFGNHIRNAQTAFLDELPLHARVLVLGGGTGSFLPELILRNRPDVIWFIDSSPKMISLACKRIQAFANVHFITGTEMDIPASTRATVVLTHFYLDLFRAHDLDIAIHQILKNASPDVIWIAADFVRPRLFYQRILLRAMYRFFRMTAGLKTETLPDWESHLKSFGFSPRTSKSFYNGFIKSAWFEKESS